MTKPLKLTSLLFGSFLLSLIYFKFSPNFNVLAHNGTHWGDWRDTSNCVANSCGTTNGSKTQTRTCVFGGNNNICSLAHQECDKGCPTINWSTSRYICPENDSAYTSNNDHKPCSRTFGSGRNKYTKYADKVTETFGPITFTYNKSSDKNECYRPTASSLNVPLWAVSDFEHDNSEKRGLVDVNCRQIPVETQTQTVSCNCATITPCPPTEVPPTEVPPSVSPSPEVTPEATPTQTPEVSGTPVPTATPTSAPNVGGGDNNGGGSNPPGPSVCTDINPGAPSNLRVTALGGGQVRLDWDHTSGPHTSYAVAYGPEIGKYLYGNPNVGNTNSYIVSALTPGAKYCFYVQAQNNCMGGSPSNVVCTGQGGTRILGVSDNYNPLVSGIKDSYGGQVLGTSTELAATAEVVYSQDKLPSGNVLDITQSLQIAKIGLDQPIYLPQKVGDELVIGHGEVLRDGNLYYAHNGYGVFSQLFTLESGDKITTIENGVTRRYQVSQKLFVDKHQVNAVKTTDGEIALMTCSVTYPDSRIVIKATLIK